MDKFMEFLVGRSSLQGYESNMHEGTLLQEDNFARRNFCTRGHFCTKTFLHGLNFFIIINFNFFFTITATPNPYSRS